MNILLMCCTSILSLYSLLIAYLIMRSILAKTGQVPTITDTASSIHTNSTSPSPSPAISIIIPFKNEAENLPLLLTSLQKQTYDAPYEIILVNDGSTDDFLPVINSYIQSEKAPINLVHHSYDPSLKLTSKQQALDAGVAIANHPTIAFTDADMELPPHWLKTLASSLQQGAHFVCGHTILHQTPVTLFSWFQAFQLEFLFATVFAFHKSGIAISCMGNNILFSRAIYGRIGGQAGIGYSIIEDRDMLAAFKQAGATITITDPFIPTATTFPCSSLKQFVQQSLRWLRGGISPSSNLWPFGLLAGFQNICLLAASCSLLPRPVLIVCLFNSVLTWTYCIVLFDKIHSRQLPMLFPLFYFFYVLETPLIALLTFLPLRISWKGRKI